MNGSFLMLNPDVRPVNNSRRYDFCSNKVSLVKDAGYSSSKSNGDFCWLGISMDEYDRAAFISLNGEKYLIGAIPPLSRDYLSIRLLIDEIKK